MEQNTQQNGKRATSMRKHFITQGAQTRASLTTEYQERFLHPSCHTAVVSSSTQKNPYHSLKGTSNEMTTLRLFYVTHKWKKQPPKAPQPSGPPKVNQRCSSLEQNPLHFEASQVASKVDYTSVYKNDFQAWKVKRRLPYKLVDSLKVNQGLVVTDLPSKGHSQKNSVQVAANCKPLPQVQKPQPFESATSYRTDYVPHPVQPRIRRVKPAHQTRDLLSEPSAVPVKPKVAWEANQDIFDDASAFFEEFKTWSLQNKFHGKGKAIESGSLADSYDFSSRTHADDTEHKCPHAKPVLPSKQTGEKSRERFGGTTTMKDDFKSWDMPQRFPSGRKEEPDWPKKTTFSPCTPKPAEGCKTTPKPGNPHPKSNERASSCNATETTHCPNENGAPSNLECNSPGTEESRMFWTTSLDRGPTWADGGTCEDSPQDHQIISCMISSRS